MSVDRLSFDEDGFIAFLKGKGAAAATLPVFRDGARKLMAAVGGRLDDASLKAFLDFNATSMAPPQLANLRKIGQAMLRFQAATGGAAPAGATAQLGAAQFHDMARATDAPADAPSRITFSSIPVSGGAVVVPAAVPSLDAVTGSGAPAGAYDMVAAPWAPGAADSTGTTDPPPVAPWLDNPPPALPPGELPRVRYASDGRKGKEEPRRLRLRTLVFRGFLLAVGIAGVVTVWATLDAFRYRSRPAGEDFFSEHLRADISFPTGWRHMVGADRRARAGALFPGAGASEEDVAMSTFFRGDEPADPAHGLTVAVVALTGGLASGPRTPDAMLLGAAADGARALGGVLAVKGAAYAPGLCEIVALHGTRAARCDGRLARGPQAWVVSTFLVFGTDRAAWAVFRRPAPPAGQSETDLIRAEAATVAGAIRLQ